VDLSISKTNQINIEIDKHVGGVSVKDCMAVSRNVEHNLDREEADFELHVSSAGIDRPLRVLAQYVKNVGRTVEVIKNDGAQIEGILKAASETEIEIETSRIEKIEGKKKKETIVEQIVLPLNSIKETKIVIIF
jgi:ribosome maturation factor RimP